MAAVLIDVIVPPVVTSGTPFSCTIAYDTNEEGAIVGISASAGYTVVPPAVPAPRGQQSVTLNLVVEGPSGPCRLRFRLGTSGRQRTVRVP